MSKAIEVKSTIENLFCCVELHPSAEDILEQMNYENLTQAIQHFAATVYAYTTWTADESGCEYRGKPLFPVSATLLYSMPYMISATESGIVCERCFELWLRDDMKIAVVSNFRTDFYDGEFLSEYRVVKTTDLDEFPQYIDVDYNLLVLLLKAMSEAYIESNLPTYEL